MTEPAQVLYEKSAGVAVITLNRPDRLNAWTARMAIEFSSALERAEHEDDVGAIVITGAGRAFCAGLDLGESPSFDAGNRPEPKTLPWHLDKPVVAAVNGHAIGVGATLALTADLRFIASAAKVQFPFVRLGLVSELGSHASLPRIVGHEVASDLLMSGRMIVGSEAADLGFASRCLDASDVVPAALAWAQDVAATTSRQAVAASKRLLLADLLRQLADVAPAEVSAIGVLAASADTRARLEQLR
jgi:enoyl-CoA hydratase/carnithine racemase